MSWLVVALPSVANRPILDGERGEQTGREPMAQDVDDGQAQPLSTFGPAALGHISP
jgi:hypothetical protein